MGINIKESDWEQVLDDSVRHFANALGIESQEEATQRLSQNYQEIVEVAERHATRSSIRDGEELCFTIVRGTIVIIGNSTTINDTQEQAIRSLAAIALKLPYPALPIARFAAMRTAGVILKIESLESLKEQLFLLLKDKEELLKLIGQVVAEQCQNRTELSIHAYSRLLVHGNSILMQSVLAALTVPTTIFLLDNSEQDKTALQRAITHANKVGRHELESRITLANSQGTDQLLQEIDLVLISSEAVGLHNEKLGIIVPRSAAELCKLANQHHKTILIVTGRYKIWPACLFADEIEILLSGTHDHVIIFPSEANWLIASENEEVLSPGKYRDLYSVYLTTPMKEYEPTPLLVEDDMPHRRIPATPSMDTLPITIKHTSSQLFATAASLQEWASYVAKIENKNILGYKTEISREMIGRSIDSSSLQEYDAQSFQVLLFQTKDRSDLREYLSSTQIPYLRIGPTSSYLLPRKHEGLDGLLKRFHPKSAVVRRSLDGTIWPRPADQE